MNILLHFCVNKVFLLSIMKEKNHHSWVQRCDGGTKICTVLCINFTITNEVVIMFSQNVRNLIENKIQIQKSQVITQYYKCY